jgi:hypothetical protein
MGKVGNNTTKKPEEESPSKKPRCDGDSGQVPMEKIRSVLGLPPQPAPRPKWPTDEEIISGKAETLVQLATQSYRFVQDRLSLWCYNHGTIQLRTPLYELECPKFTAPDAARGASGNPQNAASGARLTAFKEPWVMQNCKSSLIENGLYEAATPVWKANPIGTKPPTHHTIHQLNMLSNVWSPESYTTSHDCPAQRRFIVPGFISTYVKNIVDVDTILDKKASSFKDLPLINGHLMVWSLFRALENAFVDEDEERILLLFEASLSFSMRMRLDPSEEQQLLDQLSFIETLRIEAKAAGAESFFDFVTFLGKLPSVTEDLSGPKMVEVCKALGITYEGKKVEKTLAYAMIAVLPYTKSKAASSAIKLVEIIAPAVFYEPTKLMRACQTLKKLTQPHECHEAFEYWILFLAADLLCGEMLIEDATTEFFIGEKGGVGQLQIALQKRHFVNWFLNEQVLLAATQENCTVIGLSKIKVKVLTPMTFLQAFSKDVIFSTSSREDKRSFENLALENATKYFAEELNAVGDLAAAELICKAMVNRFDGDFRTLAASGAMLADFLKKQAEDAEESVSLPAAYGTFKKALQSAPVSSNALDTGVVYDAIPGDEESEERSKLYNLVIAKRRESVIFYHLPVGSTDIYRKGGPLTQIMHSSKFIESKGEVGKKNSLLMSSADLFPNKAALG